MTTEAQVLANRANAQKSTGPRTKIGKAVVASNAIKHGLFAHQDVIAEEDPQQYGEHRQRLLGELSPASEMETILAGRIVSLTWRLKRAETLANELFDYLLAKELENSIGRFFDQVTEKDQEDMRRYVDTDPKYAVGRMIAKDYRGEKTLDRLGMHERRIEGSLYRTMHELDRCRLMRKHRTPVETQHLASQQSLAASDPCPAKQSQSTDDGGHRPAWGTNRTRVETQHDETQDLASLQEGMAAPDPCCAKQSQLQEVSGSTPALGGDPSDPSRGRLGYMGDGPICETKPIGRAYGVEQSQWARVGRR